ncbi:G-protein coupled receptor activity protein [Polyrhizophydium stewartii]|uniref:G-protein coupled receptor activity protein n=1 Tax=Polyrhizophydium stewartii TaxID=2732419 RepID=A0ABR4MYQ0_9FUNG
MLIKDTMRKSAAALGAAFVAPFVLAVDAISMRDATDDERGLSRRDADEPRASTVKGYPRMWSPDVVNLASRATESGTAATGGQEASVLAYVPFHTLAIVAVVTGFVLSIAAWAVFQRFRGERVFRAASRTYMSIIVIGTILIWAGLMLSTTLPWESRGTCAMSYLLQYTGFAVVFGALVAKIWRVVQFSKGDGAPLPRMSDHALLRGVLAFVGLWIVAVGVPLAYSARMDGSDSAEPRVSVLVVTAQDALSGEQFLACQAGESFANFWAGLQGISIGCGMIVAVQCRNLPSAYNEIRWV